jgi:DNA repair protein RecO (recombination protein O)
MNTKINLQPALILHRYPFQNTSLILDFFTLNYGRQRAIVKGGRASKYKSRSLLQPFQPVLVSLSGRGELKTLVGIESYAASINLQGEYLFSGLYINELLIRLLEGDIEHDLLFRIYQETLLGLQAGANIEAMLREFELELLSNLGYGINLENDCSTGQSIEASEWYEFYAQSGFVIHRSNGESQHAHIFLGAHLIALRNREIEERSVLRTAKQVLRLALAEQLGGKPINSRNLFAKSSKL